MVKNLLFLLAFVFVLHSCKQDVAVVQLDGKTLLNKAIEAHGGDLFKQSTVAFELNNYEFQFTRDGYNYDYSMTRANDTLIATMRAFNGGMEYTENGAVSTQGARMDNIVRNRVNSVAYEFYIPYDFTTNDVVQTYLGDEFMRGRKYHKVKITFKTPEGGTPDLRAFVLWIDAETFEIDFVAKENDSASGRKQFSAAAYKRRVGGMLFSDFEIYQTPGRNREVSIDSIGMAYGAGAMQRVTVTTYKNITVTPLAKD